MSRSAMIERQWAGEWRVFRMAIGEIEKLEEELGAPALWLVHRLLAFQGTIKEVKAVLRLALVGGGMKPSVARDLVEAGVAAGAVLESFKVAGEALAAGINGAPEEPVGKAQAAEDGEAAASPMAGSPSPPSMPLA